MASRNGVRRGGSRRFAWLAVAIVAVVALYTAGWFYMAHILERETASAVAVLDSRGVRADCEDATARGYPFRIGLFCSSVAYEHEREGIAASAGAFRSAAQIYQPRRVIGELDGPATVAVQPLPPIRIAWETLRASARIAEPLPEPLSIEARQLEATIQGSGTRLAVADGAELHTRPDEADLDLAARFDKLALAPELLNGRTLPALDGLVDVSIANGVAMVVRPPETLRGTSATIRDIRIRSGEQTGLSVSGDAAVGEDGRVDAELTVVIENPNEVSALLQEALPEAREQIRSVFSGLAALGASPTLPVRIVDGRVFVGFFPVAEIPPLQQQPPSSQNSEE